MNTKIKYHSTVLATFCIAALMIISCSSNSKKIIGKWQPIKIENEAIKFVNDSFTYEFGENGKCFFTMGNFPNIETYDWQLSENKVVLTQNSTSLVIEFLENKILVLSPEFYGNPVFFLKTTDNMTKDDFFAIIERNKSNSNYLK